METFFSNSLFAYSTSFSTAIIATILIFFLIYRNDLKSIPVRTASIVFFSMLGTVCISVLIQRFIDNYVDNNSTLYFSWALLEEMVKLIPVYIIIAKGNFLKWSEIITYSVIAALGFATFENTLYIVGPLINTGNVLESAMSAGTRSVGATLVHIISSSILASLIALSLNKSKKYLWIAIGLISAISFHELWNLSTLNNPDTYFNIILLLWLIFVIYLFIIEKIVGILDKRKYSWKSVFKKSGGLIVMIILSASFMYAVQQTVSKYTETDIDFWKKELNAIESAQMSWKSVDNPKYKDEIDKINAMYNETIENTRSTLDIMLANGNLPQDKSKLYEQHILKSNEIRDLSNKISAGIDKDYWVNELSSIKADQASWKKTVSTKYKKELDQIDILYNGAIDIIESALSTTSLDYLSQRQSDLYKQHTERADEIKLFAIKLNSNFNKDYWIHELNGIESVQSSWKPSNSPSYIKNKEDVDRINVLIKLITANIKSNIYLISNNENTDQVKMVAKHKQLFDEFNSLTNKVNSNQ